MAVIGKQLTAVLARYRDPTLNMAGDPLSGLINVLWITYSATSTTEIAKLYPSLSWDAVIVVPNVYVRWLRQQGGSFGQAPLYATDEEAILDMENWVVELNSDGQSNLRASGIYAQTFGILYRGGAWQTEYRGGYYAGAPSLVTGTYPLAKAFNITTPAPFGTGLGNGLIQHQAVYYDPPGGINILDWPFTPDPPPANTGADVYAIDQTYIFTPIYDDGPNDSTNDGGGDGTEATDSITVRCWGFDLDGHTFYVLRLGDSGTIVYDLTTNTWQEWESPGRTVWRPHVGQNWVGCENFAAGQTDVFCGDDATGTIFRLDVTNGRDSRTSVTNYEDDKITKVVTGGVQVTGRDVVPCGAVTLDLALGNPTQTGASVQLEISDDLGETWFDAGVVEVPADDFSTVVEWRGLGSIKAPGRLFRITDDGATVRISRLDMR